MAKNTTENITFSRPLIVFLCVLVSVSIWARSSLADPFEFSADLYGGVTYTSNVGLSSSDAEDSEVVFEVSPRISASRDGKRLDVNFDYRLQGLLYTDDDERNEVYNYLQANLESILAEDFLYLDANASISQTIIDPSAGSGFSSISVSGNRAEVTTITISPYLRRNLGPYTQFTAGYSLGLVEYDESRLIDNDEQDIYASLVNHGGDSLFNWRGDYTSKTVEYDIGQEIELERISGEIGIRISPRTELIAAGGEDKNDFGALPGTGVADGSFWNVGLRGGFGENVEFEFRAGEQFFGDSYSAMFRRTGNRLSSEISYTEQATTVGAQQLSYANLLSNPTNLANLFVQSNVTGGDITGFDLPINDPELYVRKRFNFGNTYSRAKSTFSTRIYYEDRTFIRTSTPGVKENVIGAQLGWAWQYDDVTDVDTNASYQRLDSRDGGSQPEDLRLSVSVRRDVLDTSYLLVRGWINMRSAANNTAEYDELALTVGFGRKF